MSDRGEDRPDPPAEEDTPADAGDDGDNRRADEPSGRPTAGQHADGVDGPAGTEPDERGRESSDRTSESTGLGSDTDGGGPAAAGAGVPLDRPTTVTAPEEYTTDRRSLAPRVQLLWGIQRIIGVLLLGVIVAFALQGLDRDPSWAGGVVVFLILLGLVLVVLRYRIWVYQIRGDALYLERGVFTHVRTLVPYVRIQHVDTSRGPLERALGLSTLVVYTAGSRGADVSIPGLTPAEARDLQQRVKELAIDAEGDDAL